MWAPRRRLPMPTMSVGPVRHETNGRRALRQHRTIGVKESTLGENRLLAGPFDPPFSDDDPRCGRLEEAHLDLQGGDPVRGGVAGDASVRHCRIDPAGDEPALGYASGVTHLRFAREFEPRPTELAVGFKYSAVAERGHHLGREIGLVCVGFVIGVHRTSLGCARPRFVTGVGLVDERATAGATVEDLVKLKHGHGYTTAVIPPSTKSVWPLMKLAASESRKTAAPPSSSIWPQRPAGVRSATHWEKVSSFTSASVNSVAK